MKKYCSDDCYRDAVSYAGQNNPNCSGGKHTTHCVICESEFEFYPSDKKGLYCPECVENENWRYSPMLRGGEAPPAWEGGEIEKDREVCGQTIRRRPGDFEGEVAVCDKDCQRKWLSEAFHGESHPNWAGGTGHDDGDGWWRTRVKALERDDYTCQLCGLAKDDIGRNPDVHHIVPAREFVNADEQDKTDVHTLDNVITLCVACHRRTDFGHHSRGELREIIGVPAE